MNQQKGIKWLYEQLPDLIGKGILNEETASQLREHYGEVEEGATYNVAFIAASILGVLLIGAGIISIFAFNWENLSRFWRTVLSVLPLAVAQVIYGYTFFKKNTSTAWVESTSGFLMLMLASAIALISQTYNLEGSLEGFLLTWALLSIPLMYLMNSSFAAMLYLLIITSWTLNVSGSDTVFYWGLLAAFLPHFYINVRKGVTNRSVLLGWALVFSVGTVWVNIFDGFGIMSYALVPQACAMATFYLLGEYFYPKENRTIQRPFQTAVIFLVFFLSLALSYKWFGNDEMSMAHFWEYQKYETWAANINLGVWIAFIISYIGLAIVALRKRQDLNYPILIFPLFILMGTVLTANGSGYIAMMLANGFLFLMGTYYIYIGVERQRMTFVNIGMLFLMILIMARFFDADVSLIVKGVVFIILGIGFLMVNLYLSKRLKQAKSN